MALLCFQIISGKTYCYRLLKDRSCLSDGWNEICVVSQTFCKIILFIIIGSLAVWFWFCSSSAWRRFSICCCQSWNTNKFGILLQKIVLTYCEKKLFYWSKKTFEIQGWRLRIYKNFEITRIIFGNRMLF